MNTSKYFNKEIDMITGQTGYYGFVIFVGQMNEIGLQPVIDYLRMVRLPALPSFIAPTFKNTSLEFDWIRSIAEVKRTTGINVLFGFDVTMFNQTNTYIGIGDPKMNSFFPHE